MVVRILCISQCYSLWREIAVRPDLSQTRATSHFPTTTRGRPGFCADTKLTHAPYQAFINVSQASPDII
ncbi:hypothetical protein FIBSPDRAFT_848449 [Athelia psychrophila]|uniref:Uncharacterized protein n=1 Tax=Athelia psychrophila TaxID=1759441 RepID=A0A166VEN0_9AGAM|nr:hypothetical protein FIBSPDRAFT_848449 [Fibularhizoctonia sp. CBS 109695]